MMYLIPTEQEEASTSKRDSNTLMEPKSKPSLPTMALTGSLHPAEWDLPGVVSQQPPRLCLFID